jgi:hypothetical protein
VDGDRANLSSTAFPDCSKDRGEAASTSGKTFEVKERKTLRRNSSASKTDSRIDIVGTWPFKVEWLQTLREALQEAFPNGVLLKMENDPTVDLIMLIEKGCPPCLHLNVAHDWG